VAFFRYQPGQEAAIQFMGMTGGNRQVTVFYIYDWVIIRELEKLFPA
jgi:hypothetical protein